MAPRFRGDTGIVVVHGERGQREFWECWEQLELPPQWQKFAYRSYDLLHGRNLAVRTMYKHDADWLWFMDDDHTFPPDILKRLLRHGQDIVGPLVLTRYPPFRPTAHIGGKRIRWQGETGLIEVDQLGTAGLLVHRKVFDKVKIAEPVAHIGGGVAEDRDVWFRAGAIYPDRLAEDIDFCVRAKAAGFDIHCDLDATMGHMLTAHVFPEAGVPVVAVATMDGRYAMKGTFNYGADLQETVPIGRHLQPVA